MKVGDRVQAIEVDDCSKLVWPLAGARGIIVKPGHMGTVTGFELGKPLVRFDGTDADVRIDCGQATVEECIEEKQCT